MNRCEVQILIKTLILTGPIFGSRQVKLSKISPIRDDFVMSIILLYFTIKNRVCVEKYIEGTVSPGFDYLRISKTNERCQNISEQLIYRISNYSKSLGLFPSWFFYILLQ